MMKFVFGSDPRLYLGGCQEIASLITLEVKQRIFFPGDFTEPTAAVNTLLLW